METSKFSRGKENKSKLSFSRVLISNFVFLTHILIMIYIAFGWLSPIDWMLWGLIFLYLGTELLWKITGSCILTDFERKIRGIPESTPETFFMVRIIYYITRMEVSPEKSIIFVKIWGRIACLISIIRLLY